jgi:NAD(P)-dependent dehydrogenase (short-subunit alcohol dehydrogenase family)
MLYQYTLLPACLRVFEPYWSFGWRHTCSGTTLFHGHHYFVPHVFLTHTPMLASLARSTLSRGISARAFSTNGAGFSRLDGKVIVNCGAGNPPDEEHGIGAMTSIQCARLGAKVVSVSNVQVNADTVTAAIHAEGNEGMAYCCDVTKADETKKLLDRVINEYGRVDVLINSGVHNAQPNGFGKMTEEYWKSSIDTNLHAHFQLIHNFMPTFEEQGHGNIIQFTTIAGSVGLGVGKQRHPYAAGKAAAAVLTKRIGAEYAKKGVRSNVIEIGYCSGPLVSRAVAAGGADIDAVTATRDSYVPRGKQGTPQEVANVAAFLASDDSSFINATSVFCDGGSSGCTYGP